MIKTVDNTNHSDLRVHWEADYIEITFVFPNTGIERALRVPNWQAEQMAQAIMTARKHQVEHQAAVAKSVKSDARILRWLRRV